MKRTSTPLCQDAQIRWMIRRDLQEVLEIERASFEIAWDEEEFRCWLRQRSVIGIVAELDSRVVGYMVYELHKNQLKILNLAVHPEARRHGIGRMLVQRLIDKLCLHPRREIVLEVRETNLPAQLFLAACGFRAVTVLKRFFGEEDAYYMMYQFKEAPEPVVEKIDDDDLWE